jgi:hypothetical protein
MDTNTGPTNNEIEVTPPQETPSEMPQVALKLTQGPTDEGGTGLGETAGRFMLVQDIMKCDNLKAQIHSAQAMIVDITRTNPSHYGDKKARGKKVAAQKAIIAEATAEIKKILQQPLHGRYENQSCNDKYRVR